MMDVKCSAPQWLHHFHDQDLDGIQTVEFNQQQEKNGPSSIHFSVHTRETFSVQAFYFLI